MHSVAVENRYAEYLRKIKPPEGVDLRTMNPEEMLGLWRNMCRHVESSGPVKSYLEIGSCCGVSLWMMIPFLAKDAKVVCVDLCNGRSGQVDMLKRVGKHVKAAGASFTLIAKDSAKVDYKRIGPFEAALIDGDHSYEASLRDYERVKPAMVKGGLVIFHDTFPRSFGVWKTWQKVRGDFVTTTEFGMEQGVGIGVVS